MRIKRTVKFTLAVLLAAAGIAGAVLAAGQSTSKPLGPPPGMMPLQEAPQKAFGHLFYMVDRLERDADDANRRGEGGRAKLLRKHVQDRIGLKDDEAAVLKLHARAAAAAVEVQDRMARDIIEDIRKQTPDGRLSGNQRPPAVPQRLIDLQLEHDRTVADRVAMIERQLSAATFRKVESFARAEQAKALTPQAAQAKPYFVKR